MNGYLTSLKDNFKKSIIDQDIESIHDYRVDIKKIRYILRMYNDIYSFSIINKKYFSFLKRIFKLSSKLRDYQVHLEIINSIENSLESLLDAFSKEKFDKVKKFYEKRISKSKNSFKEKSEKIDFESDIDELSKFYNNAIKSNSFRYNIEPWIYSKLDELRLFNIENPEDLHKFRMLYKSVLYVIEDNKLYLCPHIKWANITDEMKSFSKDLGQWHDYYLLVKNFPKNKNKNLFSFIKEKEKELYLDVLSKIKNGKNKE